MTDICNTCGLPKDLCVCEAIAKESQRISIKIDRKKFRKEYTVISGIDSGEIDVKDLAKQLKNKLACGGTVKSGVIELQGSHLSATRDFLIKQGFAPETIEVDEKSAIRPPRPVNTGSR
jgi:translation initiation factor 1